MDERVANLLLSFPNVFERRVPSLGDLEDDFVRIDIPYRSDRDDEDRPNDIEEALLADIEDRETSPSFGRTLDSIPALIDDSDLSRGLREDLFYRPRPALLDEFRERVKGVFPGSPSGLRDAAAGGFLPPPDALAFYLPFHRYPEHWGIYLIDVGVASLSMDLRVISQQLGHVFAPYESARIASAYLFHHEAYHSAVEAFALRCELPMRRPVYKTGLRSLYARPWVRGAPHEETLATAYGLRKVRDEIKLPKPRVDAAVAALSQYLLLCPPEYAEGVRHVDDSVFVELEQRFKEEAIGASYRKTISLDPSAWSLGTYMLTPLIQRNRKYSWICDRRDFRLRSKLAIHYFRRSDIVRCLERIGGVRIEQGGNHMHLVREFSYDGAVRTRRTQVPSGEVKDGTLSGMLKDLELNLNVHSFRQRCREAGRALS